MYESEWFNDQKYVDHQILSWLCTKNGYIIRCRPGQSAQDTEMVKVNQMDEDRGGAHDVDESNAVGLVDQGNDEMEVEGENGRVGVVGGVEHDDVHDEGEDFRYFVVTLYEVASWRMFPKSSTNKLLNDQWMTRRAPPDSTTPRIPRR